MKLAAGIYGVRIRELNFNWLWTRGRWSDGFTGSALRRLGAGASNPPGSHKHVDQDSMWDEVQMIWRTLSRIYARGSSNTREDGTAPCQVFSQNLQLNGMFIQR